MTFALSLLAVLATIIPAKELFAESGDTTHVTIHPTGQLPVQVSFYKHLRRIFSKHCVGCHGGVKMASGVSSIYRQSATSEADSGDRAIVPGDVDASYLFAGDQSRKAVLPVTRLALKAESVIKPRVTSEVVA